MMHLDSQLSLGLRTCQVRAFYFDLVYQSQQSQLKRLKCLDQGCIRQQEQTVLENILYQRYRKFNKRAQLLGNFYLLTVFLFSSRLTKCVEILAQVSGRLLKANDSKRKYLVLWTTLHPVLIIQAIWTHKAGVTYFQILKLQEQKNLSQYQEIRKWQRLK